MTLERKQFESFTLNSNLPINVFALCRHTGRTKTLHSHHNHVISLSSSIGLSYRQPIHFNITLNLVLEHSLNRPESESLYYFHPIVI